MGYVLSCDEQARLISERRKRSRRERLLQVRQQNAIIAADKVWEFRARVAAGQKRLAEQLEAQWQVEHQQRIKAYEAELAAALEDVGRSQKQAQHAIEEKARRAQTAAQRAAENLQHAQARFRGALEEEQTRREMLHADQRAAKARRKVLENTMQVERSLAQIAAQNAELRQRAEEAAKAAREPVVLPVINDLDAFRHTFLHRQLLERTPLSNIPGAENAPPQQVVRVSTSNVHIKGLDDSRVAAEIERRRKEALKEKRARQRDEMQSRTDEREAAAHFRIAVWRRRTKSAAAWAQARRAAALERQAADSATPEPSPQALEEESTELQDVVRDSGEGAASEEAARLGVDKPAEVSARAEPSRTDQPLRDLASSTSEMEREGAGAGLVPSPRIEAVEGKGHVQTEPHTHLSTEAEGVERRSEVQTARDPSGREAMEETKALRGPTGRLPRIGEESPFEERPHRTEGVRTWGEAESPIHSEQPVERVGELREAVDSPVRLGREALPEISEEGPGTELREALEELVAMDSENAVSVSAGRRGSPQDAARMGEADLERPLSEPFEDPRRSREEQEEAEKLEGVLVADGEELRQSLDDFIALERSLYEQAQREERLRERLRTAKGRRASLDVALQSQEQVSKAVELEAFGRFHAAADGQSSESRPLDGGASERLGAGRRVLDVSTTRSALALDYASSDFTLLSSPLSGLSPYSLLTSPLSDFSEEDLDGLFEKHFGIGHVASSEPLMGQSGQQGGASETAGSFPLTTSGSQVTTVTTSIEKTKEGSQSESQRQEAVISSTDALTKASAHKEPTPTLDGFGTSSGLMSEEYSLRLTPSELEHGSSEQDTSGSAEGPHLTGSESLLPSSGIAATSLNTSSTPAEDSAASFKVQEPLLLTAVTVTETVSDKEGDPGLHPAKGVEGTGPDDDIFSRLKRELDAFDERLDAVRADVFAQGPQPLSSSSAFRSTTTTSTSSPSTSSLVGSAPVPLPSSVGVLSASEGAPPVSQDHLVSPTVSHNGKTPASPSSFSNTSDTAPLLDGIRSVEAAMGADVSLTSEGADLARATSASLTTFSLSHTASTHSHSTSGELDPAPDPVPIQGLEGTSSEHLPVLSPATREPPAVNVEEPTLTGSEAQESSGTSLPSPSQPQHSLAAASGLSKTEYDDSEVVGDSPAEDESQAVRSALEQTSSVDDPSPAALPEPRASTSEDAIVAGTTAASLQDKSAEPSLPLSSSDRSSHSTWQSHSSSLLAVPSSFRLQAMLAPLAEEALAGFRVSEGTDPSSEAAALTSTSGEQSSDSDSGQRARGQAVHILTAVLSAGLLEKAEGSLEEATSTNDPISQPPSDVRMFGPLRTLREQSVEDVFQSSFSQRPASRLQAPSVSAAFGRIATPSANPAEQVSSLAPLQPPPEHFTEEILQRSLSPPTQRAPSLLETPNLSAALRALERPTELLTFDEQLEVLASELRRLDDRLYAASSQSISGVPDTALQSGALGSEKWQEPSSEAGSPANRRAADVSEAGADDLDTQRPAGIADVSTFGEAASDDVDGGEEQGSAEDRSLLEEESFAGPVQPQIGTEASRQSVATSVRALAIVETSFASPQPKPVGVSRRTEVNVASLSCVGWAAALDINGPESLLGASADFSPWQGSEMSDPSPISHGLVRGKVGPAELTDLFESSETVVLGQSSRPDETGEAPSKRAPDGERDEREQGLEAEDREAAKEMERQTSNASLMGGESRRDNSKENVKRPSVRPRSVPRGVGSSARGDHKQGQQTAKAADKQTRTLSTAPSPPESAQAPAVKSHFLISERMRGDRSLESKGRSARSPSGNESEATTSSSVRSSWSSFTSLSSSPGERTEGRSFEKSLRRGASEDPSGRPGSKQEAERRKRARELKEKARAFDKEQREKRSRMRSPST